MRHAHENSGGTGKTCAQRTLRRELEALKDGQKAGVTGTPAFFIGVADGKDSKVKVQRTLKGAQGYAAFQAALDGLLAGQK